MPGSVCQFNLKTEGDAALKIGLGNDSGAHKPPVLVHFYAHQYAIVVVLEDLTIHQSTLVELSGLGNVSVLVVKGVETIGLEHISSIRLFYGHRAGFTNLFIVWINCRYGRRCGIFPMYYQTSRYHHSLREFFLFNQQTLLVVAFADSVFLPIEHRKLKLRLAILMKVSLNAIALPGLIEHKSLLRLPVGVETFEFSYVLVVDPSARFFDLAVFVKRGINSMGLSCEVLDLAHQFASWPVSFPDAFSPAVMIGAFFYRLIRSISPVIGHEAIDDPIALALPVFINLVDSSIVPGQGRNGCEAQKKENEEMVVETGFHGVLTMVLCFLRPVESGSFARGLFFSSYFD